MKEHIIAAALEKVAMAIVASAALLSIVAALLTIAVTDGN